MKEEKNPYKIMVINSALHNMQHLMCVHKACIYTHILIHTYIHAIYLNAFTTHTYMKTEANMGKQHTYGVISGVVRSQLIIGLTVCQQLWSEVIYATVTLYL